MSGGVGGGYLWEQLRFLKYLPSPNLTVKAPGKEGVGRQNIPFGKAYFQGPFLLVSGSVTWICFLVIGFFAFDQGRNDTEINPEESSFWICSFSYSYEKKWYFFQREDYLGRNVIWVFFPDILEWWFHRIFWNDSRWNEWVRCDIYKPSVIRSACIMLRSYIQEFVLSTWYRHDSKNPCHKDHD